MPSALTLPPTSPLPAPNLGAGVTTKEHRVAQAREAAEAFEALFLGQMFDMMFADLKPDGPFGGGPGSEIYRSMLNQEFAKVIARRGGIGIADHVMREIVKYQEITP